MAVNGVITGILAALTARLLILKNPGRKTFRPGFKDFLRAFPVLITPYGISFSAASLSASSDRLIFSRRHRRVYQWFRQSRITAPVPYPGYFMGIHPTPPSERTGYSRTPPPLPLRPPQDFRL
jgi:hypothetical protein